MAPAKLTNRPLTRKEAQAAAAAAEKSCARKAAQAALQHWYKRGYDIANATISKHQVNNNLKEVAAIPGWTQRKGYENGYIMLRSLLSAAAEPMIVVLDYTDKASSRLTYRQLHTQVREYLKLHRKSSLRLCPFRPWYLYMRTAFPVPEKRALPANDESCTHLLGTTVLYYVYN